MKTTYIQIQTKTRINERISLPTDKLAKSIFYSGLFECYHDNNNIVYPFPNQYIDVLPVYIDYCHHDNKIRVQLRKLKLCFNLAHYLGDDDFLQVLIQCISRSWPSSTKVIEMLDSNIQRDIYLSLPFMFIPTRYRYNSTFVTQWLIKNDEKRILGPYNTIYRTHIRLCCFNEQHCHGIDLGLTGINSHIIVGKNNYFYKHGIDQDWYQGEVGEEQKQQLKCELHHKRNKKFGIQKEWYESGILFKITHYNNNKVQSCQTFDQKCKIRL